MLAQKRFTNSVGMTKYSYQRVQTLNTYLFITYVIL